MLERTREAMGTSPGHRPIAIQGTPVIYVVRPENQPGFADWFMAQATYQDTKGQVRPHLLSFLRRRDESSFKLAVATPVHWGRRVPKAELDADGYVSMPSDAIALAVTAEYQNFWNHGKKEGESGYRLAKNSFGRKAFPEVSQGAYVAFRGRSSIYGFTTADGGSFFLFAMLNDKKHVNPVLNEAVLVPKGSKTIQEIGANWFS
ncbi:hypothetical protein AB0K67_03200 [Nonomuraea sp. NPDC052634]|uniref:hypothetical protein n=1 Tax=Nonomuraea sp. NPDC052634 TaxID=3155813 RepID=UPI003449223D